MPDIFPLNHGRRRWLRNGLLVSAALPAALAGCASVPRNVIAPPSGFIPDPRVLSGELWRYALINRYNGETITEVTARVATVAPELRVELVATNGRAIADEVYDSAWSIRQEPIYNDTLVFGQAVSLLPSKLAVGVRDQVQTTYQVAGKGKTYPWLVRTHAANWERISVPAGEFDALRIERRIGFEHDDIFRWDSRRIETLWYAPTVNRWVMREWTGEYQKNGAESFGFGGLFDHEREDSVRWVLIEHQAAPVG
ncbi:MAG: hypothetical protein WBD34_15590 [Burkholderiaceae bacterium]